MSDSHSSTRHLLAVLAAALLGWSCSSAAGPAGGAAQDAANAALALTARPPAGGLLTITNAALPNAVATAPYSAALTAAGGTRPYEWSVISGALPTGLALQRDGTVSGTAAGPGVSSFAVRV